jgi:proteasome assembly chaperone 3
MQVPMNANNPNRSSEHYLASSNEDEDFPVSHLTANTLLGGANSERETKGQLYAVQMANAIALQNPEESRTVMVGFGLKAESASREEFFDLMDLVTKCL